jgi:hypothetical protein
LVCALTSSLVWGVAAGCSSADDSPSAQPGTGGTAVGPDAPDDTKVVKPDLSGMGGADGNSLNPLCGLGSCIPDEQSASVCRTYVPPSLGTGAGGEAGQGAGGEAGTGQREASAGAGGEGGVGSGGAPIGGEGGATHAEAGQGGAPVGGAAIGGEAGQAGAGGAPAPTATYGCQVVFDGALLSRQCQTAGTGDQKAPCFSAADCKPGLACVTDGEAGRCLPYCCRGEASCAAGTYCAERPLRKPTGDAAAAEPPRVPVCVPADDCSLDEPYPCPEGMDCRCQEGTACLVVRADRTTACLTPGTGQQGDACSTGNATAGSAASCAWNHVCSSVTQQCVKLCRTDPSKNDCGKQKCQASSELPQSYGVCVGPT